MLTLLVLIDFILFINIVASSPIKPLGSTSKLMSIRNVSIRNIAATTAEFDTAENIIDDASVALHLDSHESCPYYTGMLICVSVCINYINMFDILV